MRARRSAGSVSRRTSSGANTRRIIAICWGSRPSSAASNAASAAGTSPSASALARKRSSSAPSLRMLAPSWWCVSAGISARKSRSLRSAATWSSVVGLWRPSDAVGGTSYRNARSARISRFSSWSVGTKSRSVTARSTTSRPRICWASASAASRSLASRLANHGELRSLPPNRSAKAPTDSVDGSRIFTTSGSKSARVASARATSPNTRAATRTATTWRPNQPNQRGAKCSSPSSPAPVVGRRPAARSAGNSVSVSNRMIAIPVPEISPSSATPR